MSRSKPLRLTIMVAAVGLLFVAMRSQVMAETARERLNQASIEPKVGSSIPTSATFKNHRGEEVALADIVSERPTVLCLVYFDCPMLCRLAAEGVVRAVASVPGDVGQDFNVLFVSFDPSDTPAKATAARAAALQQYDRDSGGKGWYFLTGTLGEIKRLTQSVGFNYAWDASSGQFSHSSGIIILSVDGTISQYLDGVHFSPTQLSAAIDRAANGEVTAQQAKTFIRCYLYDPTTGQFGSAIQWTLRGLGLLTVLMIGLLLFRLHETNALSRQPDQREVP